MGRVVEWCGVFPRNGWGRCRTCSRNTLTFYVNDAYLTDREAGRQSLSDILCKRCIAARYPTPGSSMDADWELRAHDLEQENERLRAALDRVAEEREAWKARALEVTELNAFRVLDAEEEAAALERFRPLP